MLVDSTEYVFQIDTGYACAAIVVEGSVVVEAAPIFRWMVGKQLAEVEQWPRILSCILCTAPDGNDETPLAEQIEIAAQMTGLSPD